MKRLFLLFFIASVCLAFSACKTVKTVSAAKSPHAEHPAKIKDYGYKQQPPEAPVQDYLTERIWRLAGINMSGNFLSLDANMDTAKINFLKNGKFEATSGITSYSGTWKKGHKKDELNYVFSMSINSEKILDSSNTIGLPFDKAFMNNLKNTAFAEIDQISIRFYSNDEELLLHFVRM